MPNVEITRGVPWHVRGSLLGLDIGLSPHALRRVSAPRVGGQPTLNDSERKGFSDSVALLDPLDLSNQTRDALAAALTRGQDQIRRLAGGTLDVEQVFADVHSIRVDGLRRRAIRWTLANDPANMEQFLSLSEILALGRPATDTFDAWGMSSAQYDSCLCTRMLAVAPWQLFTGQPIVGLLHARMADLHLRVIAVSAEIGVPATLVRDILLAAMPDYLDDVSPADYDDWLTFVRTARAFSRERIETYMTALTSSSILVPVKTGGTVR
jgi:hypothetical protein